MSRRWFSLKKFALTLAVTAMAVVGLAAAGASPATASTDGVRVRLVPLSNVYLFIEVSGASTQSGAAIIQWSYTGGSNQVWTLRPSGTEYVLVNVGSGLCIATDGVAGDWLFQAPCNGSPKQQWAADGPGGAYAFRNPASGLYMDVEGGSGWQGTHLVGWYWNGGNNQWFAAYAA